MFFNIFMCTELLQDIVTTSFEEQRTFHTVMVSIYKTNTKKLQKIRQVYISISSLQLYLIFNVIYFGYPPI